jgi:hypothetical protein
LFFVTPLAWSQELGCRFTGLVNRNDEIEWKFEVECRPAQDPTLEFLEDRTKPWNSCLIPQGQKVDTLFLNVGGRFVSLSNPGLTAESYRNHMIRIPGSVEREYLIQELENSGLRIKFHHLEKIRTIGFATKELNCVNRESLAAHN